MMMAPQQVAVGVMLLVVCFTGGCRAQLKDGCRIETLRECGDDFVPYGKRTELPATGQPFTQKCENEKRQIECSLKFVDDCLKRLPKTATSLALKTLKEDITAICTPGSNLYNDYQKAISCMNTVGTKINACLRGLHGGLERAVVKAPTKEVIHYACCSYGDVEECLGKALTQCERVGAKQLTFGLLQHVFGETLSLVCDDYTKGSQACESLPKLPALGPTDRKVENYIELLIEAASTIGRKN
ncbi:uncharacterized protein [Dermacentor andersoni]|uniref:uncharacterized protein n=1 Tax=Dermacentor andersoni TaxID=34620 RepID=UPI0024168ED2|nr:uncharacterized protein LOC126534018 [Dermacentor andersoni]